MKLKCLLFGHVAYKPNALKDNNGNHCSIIEIKDALGCSLVKIEVCERCGAVFSDLKGTR
jgi:hypothetical protein